MNSNDKTTKLADKDASGLDAAENVVDAEVSASQAARYAENLATQLRKGFLAYCVLVLCSHQPQYTGELIKRLHAAELVVVEGTIYPLLSRLQKDGLLKHDWRESEQGPPRKYYTATTLGCTVRKELKRHIKTLDTTLKTLEKGVKS